MRTRGTSPKRTPCTECGGPSRSVTGLCAPCRGAEVEPLGLDGGQWVTVRGIRRWQAVAPAPEPKPEPKSVNIGDLIACPTCHAKVSELCKTRTGRHRQEHASRLVSRRCKCGVAVEPNKKLCDFCRADARRENGRIGMQNTRARRRLEVA